ncbi:MAG: hypothetical protein NWF03_09115 [Candidatus Bathyarchaeota archaeon]|nr:hypothetical protein [Candidatus Bathyarchaeota archaeon]
MKINKLVAVGIIVAITVNLAVVLVGFGYLQNEINQLKLDSDNTQSTPEQTEQQPTSQKPQEPTNTEPEQTQTTSSTNNEPTQTTPPQSTETPEQTSSPTQTTESEGSGANLILEGLSVGWGKNDCDVPIILIGATIKNIGTQTAYGVSLHIEVWFSEEKGIDSILKLDKELLWVAPPKQVDLAPSESYSLDNRYYRERLVVGVPPKFRDIYSSYKITPMWD